MAQILLATSSEVVNGYLSGMQSTDSNNLPARKPSGSTLHWLQVADFLALNFLPAINEEKATYHSLIQDCS